jgi:hypothetical protein
MQIGKPRTSRSNDIANLRPAKTFVDKATNELVADGCGNHRVIVFDTETKTCKRHWAYGHKPDDVDLGRYDPKAPPALAVPQPGAAARISRSIGCSTSAIASTIASGCSNRTGRS